MHSTRDIQASFCPEFTVFILARVQTQFKWFSTGPKRLLLSIELYHISLTFSRLKYELDQLFSELTVRCPELAGYKSDGPLRKLEMLSGQWRRLGGTSPASTPLNRTCPTFTSSPLDRISPTATNCGKGWVTSQRYRTRQQRSSQKEMSNEERDKASKIKIFL